MNAKLKYLRFFFIVIAAAFVGVFLAAGCSSDDGVPHRQSLLIYMAGNSNLSSYAYQNLSELQQGYVPGFCNPGEGDVLLVYFHTAKELPKLYRLYKNNKNQVTVEQVKEYPAHQSLDPTVMKQVLLEAAEAYPADEYGLVVWSHGSGWLPQGYYNNPNSYESGAYAQSSLIPRLEDDPMQAYVKAVGPDSDIEMDIQALEAALPVHYDYIIFDACLMSGVEVVYELRNKADFVLASSAEILAQGFPYRDYIRPLLSGDKAQLEEVAKIYFDYYDNKDDYYRSATISLTRTSALESLAMVVRDIYAAHKEELLDFDRSNVQGFNRNNRNYFYDLADFIHQLATPQERADFEQALSRVVLYQAATPEFLGGYAGFRINTHCGLTTYIPSSSEAYLIDFYPTLAWNGVVEMVD